MKFSDFSRTVFRRPFRILVAALFASLLLASPVWAVGQLSWPQSSVIYMAELGLTITVDASSTANALSVTATTFTVTTVTGDAMTIRMASTAGRLTNDGGLNECLQPGGGTTDIIITIPASTSVTFTPGASPCASSGGGGAPISVSTPASVTVVSPNGGETLVPGSQAIIQWQTSNNNVSSLVLKLSTDGGATYPTTIAGAETNDGVYQWFVPTLSTTRARVRIEASTAGTVTADESNADFAIRSAATTTTTTETTVVPPTETVIPVRVEPVAEPEILVLPPQCFGSSLIKSAKSSTIYYCSKAAKRYVFPTSKVYFSWYSDFSGVTNLSDEALAALPLAGNITYRPGIRLVKIVSDPKVYYVATGGVLRHVASEALARAIYGDDWANKVDDLEPTLFAGYRIGEPLTTAPTETLGSATASATAATDACVKQTTFTELLALGSSRPQVKPLQALLRCLGHFPASITPSGYFGLVTQDAVKKFQAAKGLTQVGFTGAGTRVNLNKY